MSLDTMCLSGCHTFPISLLIINTDTQICLTMKLKIYSKITL